MLKIKTETQQSREKITKILKIAEKCTSMHNCVELSTADKMHIRPLC